MPVEEITSSTKLPALAKELGLPENARMKCKEEFLQRTPREQAHFILLLTIFEKLKVLDPPVSQEYLRLMQPVTKRLS